MSSVCDPSNQLFEGRGEFGAIGSQMSNLSNRVPRTMSFGDGMGYPRLDSTSMDMEPGQAGMDGIESIDHFASSLAVDGRSPWNVVPRPCLSPANSLVCNGYGNTASLPVYTLSLIHI